jgi:hypothetical protein
MKFIISGMAVGMSVTEFNELKDLEVMTFRRNILNVCKEAVDQRDAHGYRSQALYVYPPDIESSDQLPQHLAEKISGGRQIIEKATSLPGHENSTLKITDRQRCSGPGIMLQLCDNNPSHYPSIGSCFEI